ncbi:MAG TPA: hypothetical protein VJM50_05350 [Pyrinomonadaceae bacterium]|nr:hypothetical protein [Pyrinomonadaceae bacterium]
MTHTKCPQCGLVNWASDEICERCGAPLHSNDTNAPAQESPTFPTLTFGQDVSTGSRTLKVILIVIVVLALGGGAFALYKRAANSRRPSNTRAMRKVLPPPTVEERTRDTMLAYLTQPGFAGTKVVQQVLGRVRLEMLYVPDREVYFSAPPPEQEGDPFETMVAHFIIDPKRIMMAEDDGTGQLRLGKYSLRQSPTQHFFFKTPVDNIKFHPATVLKFPFKLATYTLAMHELTDFLENKSIFGGRMHARMEQGRSGLPVIFANHGALVARPEETSLRRFVDELTRDIPAEGQDAREARVQRLLDFVSREIVYDQRATTYNFELLKRPNEVLMSGESDCSNKAILLGSLLEQIGEDYLFIYTPDHITVAVRQGHFPVRNGLSLEWEGQTWLIAEGTAPGFRIGIDRLREEARFKQFKHIQRPRDRDVIFDLATGRQLSFQ